MKQPLGFTLIELLIVVGIIGILSAIAYPCYTAHVVKVRRNLAATVLMDAASRLEQYYAVNNKFSGTNLESLGVQSAMIANHYALSLKADADVYLLQATPLGSQAVNDGDCGILSLNQNGEKGASGKGDSACWN